MGVRECQVNLRWLGITLTELESCEGEDVFNHPSWFQAQTRTKEIKQSSAKRDFQRYLLNHGKAKTFMISWTEGGLFDSKAIL